MGLAGRVGPGGSFPVQKRRLKSSVNKILEGGTTQREAQGLQGFSIETHIFMGRNSLQFNSTHLYASAYYVPGSTLDAGTATAKSLQSCPTLCDPIDGSPPGSPVPGILQARTLEWVAMSFSNV